MEHVLYRTSDPDAPSAIRDRNGEVVLDCCRVCGLGESELDDTPECPGPRRSADQALAYRRGWAAFILDRAPEGCPYLVESDLRSHWLAGYVAAKAQPHAVLL